MENEVLLFSYFKGHGDGLHLAVSNDGYNWKALHNDGIFLRPEAGVEKIMRDPCLYWGRDDKFHLVWTSGWHERGIGYASSTDLLKWSEQRWIPVMNHIDKTRNCWAPEIFFYEPRNEYIIYWSSTIDGIFSETQPYGDDGLNHRIYFSTTRDFHSFSKAALLYDGSFNSIDANIVKDGDRYLLFIKDETLSPVHKHLKFAVANDPFSFGRASGAITPSRYWAEGPTAIKVNDEWIVYFDKYKISEMGAIRSVDLRQWEDISHLINFPKGAQHGYVQRVPSSVVSHLL